VYWHGATVRSDPSALVTENLRTIPMYVDFGNFRPLGRMLEWSADVAAYLLVELLHLPTNIALRVVAALAAVVLTLAATLFAEAVTAPGRMFAAPPSRAVTLLPFALAASLTAAGPRSTSVFFGGLYFLSSALVLAVAAWICRSPRPVPLVLLAGAMLATVNEVAALALPVATVALAARSRFVLGHDPRETLRRLRPAGLLWLGFLPVFVPVRLFIAVACRDGDCYRGSDLALGPGALEALPHRLVAWLPPLQWFEVFRVVAPPGRLAVVVALLVLGLLGVHLLRDLRPLGGLERGPAVGLAVAGAAVLLAGAALGSVNPQGQEAAAAGRWGAGWRDSAMTAPGGALLVAGLLGLVTRAAVQRAAVAVAALLAAGSALANSAFTQYVNSRPQSLVTNAIAAEVAQFDDSAAGDARRCALRQRHAEVFAEPYTRFAAGELPGTHSRLERLDVTVTMATGQMYGRRFCRGGRP
jgi:hypothetical protein